MPSRNVRKPDIAETFYHIYARGINKQAIFLEMSDYIYFTHLLSRYLSPEPQRSKAGTLYPHHRPHIELLAYCLMSNHIHLLVYQKDRGAMTALMKSLMTSYCQYFNLKYHRSGSIYESTYKASPVTTPAYLTHISRYIHLNPRSWKRYPYSSIAYYLGTQPPEWLAPDKISCLFADTKDYEQFLRDYEGQKAIFDELKHELASS